MSRTIDRYNDPDDSWYLEFDIERIEEEYLEDFDANRIDAGDYPGNSINELERKADEAMYQNKSEYYARTGKDRRRREADLCRITIEMAGTGGACGSDSETRKNADEKRGMHT